MAAQNEQDLSSFMAILIMTIGCLVVLLVSNTIIIVSNPENTSISTVIRSSIEVGEDSKASVGPPFPAGNRVKEPSYIDVYQDHLIIYPGEDIVPVRDLELEGNAFDKLVQRVAENKDKEYIVLLVRPRSALIARRLKKAIRQRGIDLGYELFEAGRPVDFEAASEDTGE